MKSRVLTALVLIPPVVASFCFSQPWALLILAMAGILICQREFFSIKACEGLPVSFVALLSIVMASGALVVHQESAALYGFALLFMIGVAAAWKLPGKAGFEIGSLWFAAPLLALPCLHGYLKLDSFSLARPTLLCVLPLWVGDTAAIFVGKAFGKHLLAPSISPSKTWEGAIANALGCVAAGIGFGSFMHVPLLQGALVGALCGVLGQTGDLFESWLKRRAGVKDSGALLPGHGGLLDRVDSLIMSAIPTCLVLMTLR